MSPEQAEMSGLGVDTRSDIYSLGVLLFELLTGSTPLSDKRVKDASYAEILRIIKEEEPPMPSTRLNESGETLALISANRQMEPARLAKLLRGELDWIVMKSLEKDRGRRYETATALAADIERHLTGEPVVAAPPGRLYRMRKYIRRHRAAVLTGTALAGLLVTGMIGTTWGMFQAWRATERAAESKLFPDGPLVGNGLRRLGPSDCHVHQRRVGSMGTRPHGSRSGTQPRDELRPRLRGRQKRVRAVRGSLLQMRSRSGRESAMTLADGFCKFAKLKVVGI